MQIVEEVQLDFDDVLLKPKWSPNASRNDVDLYRDFFFYHSKRAWTGFPLMVANMDTTGTFAMNKSLRMTNEGMPIVCLHKHYPLEKLISLHFHGLLSTLSPRIVSYLTKHLKA